MRRTVAGLSVVIMLAILTAGMQRAPSAEAGSAMSITVDRTDDVAGASACTAAPSDCSLRGAIIFANAHPGSIVTVPAGTYTLTITSGGSAENAAATGDLDINASVTINGAGAASTIITTNYTSACGDCKVFGVNQTGNFSGLTVAINNLTISGGYNFGANSGTNYCGTFFETGGGIDFYLTGTGNTYSMTNVTVTNNQAKGCNQSHGGGINVDSRNQATPAGASAGTVTFTNVTVTNNTADQQGGGISLAADKHDVTLTNVTATGNDGRVGGGVWIQHSFGGTVSFSGGSIANNTGQQGGGGIQIDGNQVVNMDGVSITGNTAVGASGGTGVGGGVVIANLGALNVTGSTTISNSAITNNHADGGSTGGGGGFYVGGNYNATIKNSTISGNTAIVGAGIYNNGNGSTPSATLDVTNSTVSGNLADTDGGGIYIRSASSLTTLTNVTVSNNRADSDSNSSGAGGGIRTAVSGLPTLKNTIVVGNFRGGSGATADDVNGTVDGASSFNVIGSGGSGGLTNGANNNHVGVNALLAPLSNYGGSLLTHALLPGSPAINAGSNALASGAGITADERGISRPQQSVVDIGAFESRGFTLTKAGGDNQTAKITTAFASPLDVQVTSAFSEPVDGGQVTFTPPGSGASAALSPNPATISSGHATTTATANSSIGTYTVSAAASGGIPNLSFTLTNIAPDLTATKANTVSGTTRLGTTWQWQTTISNIGNATADYTNGQTIFTDVMPASGVSYGSPSIGASSGVTGTILCALSGGNTVACTASGAVSIAATSGTFRVDVTATPSTVGVFTNPTGGVCKADPNNDNLESNESNNTCSDTVTVTAPDLTASKTNTAGGTVATSGTWQWQTTVTNGPISFAASADFTSGQVIFRDVLPAANVSYGTPTIGATALVSGTITCTLVGGNAIECSASGAVSIAPTGTFRVDVTATPTASGTFVNPTGGVCKADPDSFLSESDETNNTCTNTVNVFAPPTVSKAFSPAAIAAGGQSQLTFTISNPAGNPGNLTGVTLTDIFPANVVAANPPLISTTNCGGLLVTDAGGLSYGAGDNGIKLNNATVVSGTPCVVVANVTSSVVGIYTNTSGAVSSTEGGAGNTASATLTVLNPPTISKAFSPTQVAVGGTSTVTLTLTNPNTGDLHGAAFTDTFPANMTAAGGSVTGTCVGTSPTSLSVGATSASFTGITIPGTSPGTNTCTVIFNVKVTVAGASTNTTSGVTTTETPTAGAVSNPATLTVVAPPIVTKSFFPDTIVFGQTSTLTITVANPNGGSIVLTGIAFTDTLPAGVTAPNGIAGGSCSETHVTSNTINYSGQTLLPGLSCTVTVTVTGAAVSSPTGHANTITSVTSNEGGTNAAPASANLVVNKANTTTTITGDTPDPSVTGQSYSVTASVSVNSPGAGTPSGTITVSDGTGATCNITAPSGSCPLTSTSAGAKSLIASYGGDSNFATSTSGATNHQVDKANTTVTITSDNPDPSQPGQNITVAVTVAAASPGAGTPTGTVTVGDGVDSCAVPITLAAGAGSCTLALNTPGSRTLTATYVGDSNYNGNSDTESHTVAQPPTLTKTFSPDQVPVGGTSTLTFDITNPNGGSLSLSSIAFTDTLPAGLTVTSGSSGQCGGTLTRTAPSTISFSGGALAAGANCSFNVTVTGTTAGVKINTTGAISSTEGGTGLTATDTLTVVGPPTLTKSFSGNAIGGTATIQSASETGTTATITTTAAHGFASGQSVTVAGVATAGYNGTFTITGTTTTSFTYTAGASNLGSAGAGGTATVSGVRIAKGATSQLQFTVTNPNATVPLTGIGFTDTLPAGLAIVTANTSNVCGAGSSLAVDAVARTITLTNGTVAGGGSTICTFTVTVTGSTEGHYTNTVSSINSTEGGASSTPATATLDVFAPPTVAKAFNPASIQPGGTSTMTITFTNPATNPGGLTGIGITDNLPANMVVHTTPAATTSCGSTFSPASGATTLTFSGGAISTQGNSCAISVVVKVTGSGPFVNTTGNVQSTEGGAGSTATATLTTTQPPTISKAFTPASIVIGTASALRFTITNPNASQSLSGIAFTDNLPVGIEVHSAPNVVNGCGGAVTAVGGSRVISLSGGTSPANTSCTIDVQVRGTLSGARVNTTDPITATESGAGVASAPATLTMTAPTGSPNLSVSGDSTPVTIPVSPNPFSFTFVVANNTATPMTGVGVQITLPNGLLYKSFAIRRGGVSVPANPNGGPNCTPPSAGKMACQLGTLAPGDALTIVVTVTRLNAPANAQLCATALASGTSTSAWYASGASCAR